MRTIASSAPASRRPGERRPAYSTPWGAPRCARASLRPDGQRAIGSLEKRAPPRVHGKIHNYATPRLLREVRDGRVRRSPPWQGVVRGRKQREARLSKQVAGNQRGLARLAAIKCGMSAATADGLGGECALARAGGEGFAWRRLPPRVARAESGWRRLNPPPHAHHIGAPCGLPTRCGLPLRCREHERIDP